MLALALLALPSADARSADYHKCSGTNPVVGPYSYLTSTAACACLGASPTSSDWWGGVDTKLPPDDAPDGTCFENDVWESSFTGYSPTHEAKVRSALYDVGDAIASKNSALWFESEFDLYSWSWTEAGIVSMDGGHEISNPIHPPLYDMPWIPDFHELSPGGPYMMLDPDAEPWFELFANAQVRYAFVTDSNDDGMADVVVSFENGDVWEVLGPIHHGEMIHPPNN